MDLYADGDMTITASNDRLGCVFALFLCLLNPYVLKNTPLSADAIIDMMDEGDL